MKIKDIILFPYRSLKIVYEDVTNFTKDLLDVNTSVSTMRFWRLITILNLTTEWQHAIWMSESGIYHPDPLVVGFAAGIMGISMIQKSMELNHGIKI